MISNIDFSTANADVLASGLDTITFSELAQGDALKLTTSICDGDSSTVVDSWSTTYYADEYGAISLHNLASLWRSYIIFLRRRDDAQAAQPPTLTGGIRVVFAYEMADGTTASCTRRIWYTRQDIGNTTVAALNSLVPFISRKKRTFPEASERIYIAGPGTRSIKVEAVYVRDGAQAASTYNIPSVYNSFVRSADVSPSAIQALLPANSSLREYTVRIYNGQTLADECRYISDQAHYPQRVEVAWLNRWGVYETLWLVGSETISAGRNAQYAYAGSHYIAMDVTVEDTREQSTGYGPPSMVEQVRDMAESPDVWLYDYAAALWRRITITDVDVPQTRPSNQACTGTVKYRIAKQF